MNSILSNKTIVFTITSGRTGTTLLTNLLATLPDTKSTHEPDPGFHEVMRSAQNNPFEFVHFWDRKLKQLAVHKETVYVETSNVFSKGFLQTLLRLKVIPKLIFLNRSPRKIALSLLSRNSIPGKTSNGLKYSVSPNDPISLPLLGNHWSDYQRCYWAAIDSLFKQDYIKLFYTPKLGGIFELKTKDISDPDTFGKLINFIYPFSHEVHKLSNKELIFRLNEVVSKKHNLNKKSLGEEDIPDIEQQEIEILNFINFYYPTWDCHTLHSHFG